MGVIDLRAGRVLEEAYGADRVTLLGGLCLACVLKDAVTHELTCERST